MDGETNDTPSDFQVGRVSGRWKIATALTGSVTKFIPNTENSDDTQSEV